MMVHFPMRSNLSSCSRVIPTTVVFLLVNLTLTLTRCSSSSSDHEKSPDVRLPPSLNNVSAGNTWIVNDTVTLNCQTTGYPTPTIVWYKNGVQLDVGSDNNDSVHLYQSNSVLVLSHVTTSDCGSTYGCTASNKWGTALGPSVTNPVVLAEAQLGPFARSQENVSDAFDYDIDSFNVGLAIPCHGAPKSVPAATFHWKLVSNSSESSARNSFVGQCQSCVLTSNSVQIDDLGTLYYANTWSLSAKSSDVYLKCVAYNNVLNKSVSGSLSEIDLPGNDSSNGDSSSSSSSRRYIAPSVAFNSTAKPVALVGQSVTFSCFFYGFPTPTITWSRAGTSNRLPALRHTLSHFNSRLTIDNLVPSDAGKYMCKGSNVGGAKSLTMDLTIHGAPIFTTASMKPHNVNSTDGDNVTFNCKPFANPTPTIDWFINGSPLNVTALPDRYNISSDLTSLTVKNVCKECCEDKTDLMVVRCVVANEFGTTYGEGYLNVLAKTSIKIGPTNQTIVVGVDDEFQLDCQVVSDPSTPVYISWLHDGIPIDATGYKQNQTISGLYTVVDDSQNGHSTLIGHVADSSPSSAVVLAGIYTCRASNGYSVATADACVETTKTSTTAAVNRAMSDALPWEHSTLDLGSNATTAVERNISSSISTTVALVAIGTSNVSEGDDRTTAKTPITTVRTTSIELAFERSTADLIDANGVDATTKKKQPPTSPTTTTTAAENTDASTENNVTTETIQSSTSINTPANSVPTEVMLSETSTTSDVLSSSLNDTTVTVSYVSLHQTTDTLLKAPTSSAAAAAAMTTVSFVISVVIEVYVLRHV